MTKKTFKCPFCKKEYLDKASLYIHMEKCHKDELCGYPAAQVYFNFKNKYALTKGFGKSIISGKPTKFNLTTERYEKFANAQERQEYREQFRKRMIKKYGKDTLLNDPNQQKKMLADRKISGEYIWPDGSKTVYTGTYEKTFLEFIDTVCSWESSSDIMAPAPITIEYVSDGETRFHIPDFYIQSINMLVNIKSSTNMGYRLRDIDDEKLEDRAIKNTDYNYVKIYDNNFSDFVAAIDYLRSLDDDEKPNRIYIVRQ